MIGKVRVVLDITSKEMGAFGYTTRMLSKKSSKILLNEVYYLFNAANDQDYGQESIEILLNVMENNHGRLKGPHRHLLLLHSHRVHPALLIRINDTLYKTKKLCMPVQNIISKLE